MPIKKNTDKENQQRRTTKKNNNENTNNKKYRAIDTPLTLKTSVAHVRNDSSWPQSSSPSAISLIRSAPRLANILSRWVSISERARDNQHERLMLEFCDVIVIHTAHLEKKRLHLTITGDDKSMETFCEHPTVISRLVIVMAVVFEDH
ncbi:hypothetical protein MAR_007739 [Mya arenaria]|uniref:Uncharacterized protein n=1 Tax=Mya arenaria TaxID=6604 RepID=A0ABY7E1Y6_MYAAR|nr:hypothetical protein MAR_007739 [Mya arenaria]